MVAAALDGAQDGAAGHAEQVVQLELELGLRRVAADPESVRVRVDCLAGGVIAYEEELLGREQAPLLGKARFKVASPVRDQARRVLEVGGSRDLLG